MKLDFRQKADGYVCTPDDMKRELDRIGYVVDVDRVRSVGPTLFADLTVAVSRTLATDRVVAIKSAVSTEIDAELPEAEVNVVAEPRALSDESALERIMVIARNRALAVHHVTVHTIGDKLSVSLDLEVDGALPLREAHAIADRLEAEVAAELGPDVEVETHIEPLQTFDQAGADAPGARVTAVRGALIEIARTIEPVGEIHDVRVRQTPEGEIVNFHCSVDPALTVRDVHEKVDDVERALRARFPQISRVIGHAEPRA